MRIGINGGILLSPITGIGKYTLSLIKELSRYNHTLHIYLPCELGYEIECSNEIIIRTGTFSSRFGKKLWEQIFLPKMAKKDNLDLFWSPSHHLPLFLSKRIARVVTIHDMVWCVYPKTMKFLNWVSEAAFMPRAIIDADIIITISKSTENDVLNKYPGSKYKIVTIPNGYTRCYDDGTSNEFDKLSIKGSYILFVGTIEPRKNLDRLISAYSILPSDIKDSYRLIIAGMMGWKNTATINKIKSLGLEENIRITGYVTERQLCKLYKNADLFVMPSLYEGFGFPLLEAMSVGTPILTSNTSSMPEVVGEAGVFVDPLNTKSISQGINLLLSDSVLRKKISKMGVERARNFTWDKAAELTLNSFELALKARQSKLP